MRADIERVARDLLRETSLELSCQAARLLAQWGYDLIWTRADGAVINRDVWMACRWRENGTEPRVAWKVCRRVARFALRALARRGRGVGRYDARAFRVYVWQLADATSRDW